MVPYTNSLFGKKRYSVFVVFNPFSYVKESRVELGKVVWPTRNETVRLTLTVLVVSIVIGAYIAGLDAIFTKIAERFIK